MSWKLERVYSGDYIGKLTAENHISHDLNTFQEIYGVTEDEQSGKGRLVQHTIFKWQDERTTRNEEDNPLDIIIWEKEGQLIWEPVIEHSLHLKFLEENGKNNYRFGYICGTLSPFGKEDKKCYSDNFQGYEFWQETGEEISELQ